MRWLFRAASWGVLFGHFGDWSDRKVMLILTITIMALGTFAVGLLPTYAGRMDLFFWIDVTQPGIQSII